MALISTVSPENAEGTIKEGYEMFLKRVGIIPKPFEMLSASPGLFELQLHRNRYFGKHPKLSFALLAHIRYLVSHNLGHAYCMDFNRLLIKKLGIDEETIRAMETDPTKSMLEEHENAMLAFVVKSVKDPKSTTAEDISRLKNLGWEESDMVDALAQGVGMIDVAIMMQTFHMDQNCLVS